MKKNKILVVDDSRLVLSFHSNILEAAGYECVSVENGYVALEHVLRDKFDLVMTDLNMPKMDGYEFILQLRKRAEYSEVPVLMVSTEGDVLDIQKGYEVGATAYLVKPVNSDSLVAHVKMLLGA